MKKVCSCKTHCKVMYRPAVFCHEYWQRHGEMIMKECYKHSGRFHFNNQCIFCLYEDETLKDTMLKAGFHIQEIMHFIGRMRKVIEKQNKMKITYQN